MKREEFIKRIDWIIEGNRYNGNYAGQFTCIGIEEEISKKARFYYEKEFRLASGGHWVIDFAGVYIGGNWGHLRRPPIENDFYCLRAICLNWFKIWSLEEKHYLKY